MTLEQLKQQLEQLNSQVEKLNKVFSDFEASNTSSNRSTNSKENKGGKDNNSKNGNKGNQKTSDKAPNQTKNNSNNSNKEQKEDTKDKKDKFGYFDGKYMVTDDGEKFEIYSNYAAKSKLVYGDKMKMYQDRGRNMFKQVEKIDRKELEGFLTQHGDQWLFVTHSGSFKVSSAAVEHQNGKDGDEVVAIVPKDIADASFATLDRVIKDHNVSEVEKTPLGNKNVSKANTKTNNAKRDPRQESSKSKNNSSTKNVSQKNSQDDSKQKLNNSNSNSNQTGPSNNSSKSKDNDSKGTDENKTNEAPLSSDTELKVLFEDDLR